MFDKPAVLVPQSLTGEVRERVDFRGHVLCALDETALRETVRALKREGVASIAVCLLFSFLHPAHELRVRDIIAQEMPGCSVSLSCEVLPQIREYFRLSTTVINAYLQPILARYIAQLEARLAAARITTRQKYIMQSNGGMSTFAAAARRAAPPAPRSRPGSRGLCRWTPWRARRASSASSTSRWRRPSRRSRPCAATICAISCCSPSAAPGRCMPPASRAISAWRA